MKFFILFGGNSYEHEISIVSAMAVAEKLGGAGFIYCSYEREFFEISPENMKASYFSSEAFKKQKRLQIGRGGFYRAGMFSKQLVNEGGVLINLIHGKDGEDGLISGMLEFFEVDFIGARTAACALSFDKALTKDYAAAVGVKTLPARVVKSAAELGSIELPAIAKPARLGSSIGIAVAKSAEELNYAYESAAEFDSVVLFEPFIAGVKEINLAGFRAQDGKLVFSRCEEPAKAELLGFSDKYLSFKQREAEAADLPAETVAKLHEEFAKIYGHIFDGALIRCDFFIHEGEVYLNEINPHPGSLANYLFEDFAGALKQLKRPRGKVLGREYEYLNKIVQAK